MSVPGEVKISIIMSTYNPGSGEALKKAVYSMCRQTFTDWEMLLYDDGSDRQYVERIKEAAALDSRIRLMRGEENRGLANGLNQCLKEARGRYVARMDDDDVAVSTRLEKEYQFLENHQEYQWVGANSVLFDTYGSWGCEKCPEIPVREDFLPHSPYVHPSVMFRREILMEAGGYLVAWNTTRSEDYELFMRLHALGFRGYNIQEPLLYYREGVHSYRKKKLRYRIQEMTIRYGGFKKLGIFTLVTVPYVVKPVIVGLIPSFCIRYIKRKTKKDFYAE